jgi:acetyltransferase-like isoleucine patch superfamily enzyme
VSNLLAKFARRVGWRYISRGATVRGNVRLGRRVRIDAGAQLTAEPGESIELADDSIVMTGSLLMPYGGRIVIGRRVGINPYCVLYGHGGLEIGDDVLIATGCTLVPANHNFDRLDAPINSQGLTCRGIRIENDVWLGARVTVLDGVTIGHGAVIGAGAVVTRDIPSFAIAVGVPARIVGHRGGKAINQQAA